MNHWIYRLDKKHPNGSVADFVIANARGVALNPVNNSKMLRKQLDLNQIAEDWSELMVLWKNRPIAQMILKYQLETSEGENEVKIVVEQQEAMNDTGISAFSLLFRKVRALPGIGERVGIIWGRMLALFDHVTDLWRKVDGMETRFSVLSQNYERFQREVSVTRARQEAVFMQQSLIITSQGSALQQQAQRVKELIGAVQYLFSQCSPPQRRDSGISFSGHPSLLSFLGFWALLWRAFHVVPK
ncbi:hypothetical protein HDU67_006189 [Dinochytrium kinnereticum]|nr:hypothetical protein HDU67_006189 [Dinochytrium kinnereticum]